MNTVENTNVGDRLSASVAVFPGIAMPVTPRNRWYAEAWRGVRTVRAKVLGESIVFHDYSNAYRLWREEYENLVTTVGKNKLLDATFKTGLTTPAWYLFLKGTGSVAASDTMASHAGWSENTTYSESVRQTWTPGTISAGSVDNTASRGVFTISGSTTIYGTGIVDNSTKGGSTGTLYGVGDFSVSRALDTADVLNVGATLTAS